MSDRTSRTGAIVLAGGRSSRFGRDKLVEPIDGRRLIDHAVDAVRSLATDIVVVAAPGTTLATPAGTRMVHDPVPFGGPLVGLGAGLAAFAPDVDRVIVVAGDMPTLVPAVLVHLLVALDDGDGHEVAVLLADGDPRPLPMALRRAAAEASTQRLIATGERRLRAMHATLRTAALTESEWRQDDPAGATTRDIDTPADLPTPGSTRRPAEGPGVPGREVGRS